MAECRELKEFKENISSSHTKGEGDCAEPNIEIFNATMNHDGPSPPNEKELHDLDRQIVVTFIGDPRTPTTYIEAIQKERDALAHEVENLREQGKDVEALEMQLTQITVELERLRKDREALICEAECTLEEIKTILKDREAINREVEELRGQHKDPEVLGKLIRLIVLECDELRKVAHTSEETEAITKDSDVLNLEDGNVRIPCEEVAALEGKLSQSTVEPDEPRRYTDGLIDEAIGTSEETKSPTEI
jgi:DNA repair exonuclease SbcCD ATPase subunit